MQVNPITKREIKITARGKRYFIEILVFEVILMLTFIISLNSIFGKGNVNSSDYNMFGKLFPLVGLAELLIMSFVIPVMTGASISGEKERQTFDIMLTTSIKPSQIVWGKLMSVIVRIMMFAIAGVPIMAVSFVSGSVSWGILFLYLLMVTIYAFFLASIGIYASSVCRKSMSAIIFSFVLVFFMIVGTLLLAFVEYVVFDKLMISSIFLLLNPVMYFGVLFSISAGDGNTFKLLKTIENMEVNSDHRWIIAASIIFVVFTIFFIVLSARRIDPLKGNKKV
ncbi:MAG: ABC transporter permease subunit [Eubacterium sp.]|nr:ABC transporter permease subunit [Eubacterium sp.]